MEDYTDFSITLKKVTTHAILVDYDGKEIWLPKKCISLREDYVSVSDSELEWAVGNEFTIFIKTNFAIEKGLI